jgi:hypothetical protein
MEEFTRRQSLHSSKVSRLHGVQPIVLGAQFVGDEMGVADPLRARETIPDELGHITSFPRHMQTRGF